MQTGHEQNSKQTRGNEMNVVATGNTEAQAKSNLDLEIRKVNKEYEGSVVLWSDARIYGDFEQGYKLVKDYKTCKQGVMK